MALTLIRKWFDGVHFQDGAINCTRWTDGAHAQTSPTEVVAGHFDGKHQKDGGILVWSYRDGVHTQSAYDQHKRWADGKHKQVSQELGSLNAWQDITATFSLGDWVVLDATFPLVAWHVITSPDSLNQYHEVDASIAGEVGAWYEIATEITNTVSLTQYHDIEAPLVLSAYHEIVVEMLTEVGNHHSIVTEFTSSVSRYHVIDADIFGLNAVGQWHEIAVDMPPEVSQILVIDTSVTIGGKAIEFDDLKISIEEGNPLHTCSFRLLNLKDKPLVKPYASVVVTIGADTFPFYVSALVIDRTNAGSIEMSVRCEGHATFYTNPYAAPLTKTWDTATMAKAIVEELLTGAAVNWQIVDWQIPGYRVAIDRGNRLDLALRIVEAAGGVLEADFEGGFVARYKHPHPTTKLNTITPDFEQYTSKDILEIPERLEVVDYFDRVRIMDVDTGNFSDRIDFEVDESDSLFGTLRCWPYPYTTNVTLSHTSDSSVTLSRQGVVVTQVVDEVVEIRDGVGTTAYPIDSIDSLEWLKKNLLGVVYDRYTNRLTTTHETESYSLIRLSYRTRAIHYRANTAEAQAVQFLVERS